MREALLVGRVTRLACVACMYMRADVHLAM
jgi:hypothetical protein